MIGVECFDGNMNMGFAFGRMDSGLIQTEHDVQHFYYEIVDDEAVLK